MSLLDAHEGAPEGIQPNRPLGQAELRSHSVRASLGSGLPLRSPSGPRRATLAPRMADPRVDELNRLLPQCLLADWVRIGSRALRLFRDQHHPRHHDALLNRLVEQARASADRCQLRRTRLPAVHYPPDLPITARKDEIVAAIRAHQVVVIAGETGSGKTTQLPKMCLEAGLGIEGRIGCTQPRRVAALSISRRIAEELNVAWGREVGCKYIFQPYSLGGFTVN